MPATSEARINSNRINAQMSTGPRTALGKSISRKNGLKHGMTGAGVVLLDEDASEVEVRAGALMAELDPKSTLGKILVGQIATLSVRMEKGAKREEEALAGRVRHSAEAFDHDRIDCAEFLFKTIADDPRANLIDLRRSPEGVARLIEAWAELRDILTRSDVLFSWGASHQALMVNLLGLQPDRARGLRIERLSMAVRDEINLPDPEWVELDNRARRVWARDRLVERIDLEIAGLQEHRATFDLGAIALDRAGAADLAAFDDSPEGSLARRYESEARRGFFKSLKEFRQVEAEVVADEPPIPSTSEGPEPVAVPGPLGSSCARPSPTPREPKPAPRDWLAASTEADFGTARGLDGRVPAAGRAVVVPG
jgi:hypothetical protein